MKLVKVYYEEKSTIQIVDDIERMCDGVGDMHRVLSEQLTLRLRV